MKKILFFVFALLIFPCHADVLESCIEKIKAKPEQWQNVLFGSENTVFAGMKDTDQLTNEIVLDKAPQIYATIAGNFYTLCFQDLPKIAKLTNDRAKIPFTHNGLEYFFDFSLTTMFDYVDLRMGIMVMNNRNLRPGIDKLAVSDVQKDYFFNADCSDHNVMFNLSDDAAVNVAGQATFSEFGGSSNEFYLDFPEGHRRRAFPGLVIMDKTGSSTDEIVIYRNMKTAVERTKAFADKLKNKACANQNLAVYLVVLDVVDSSANTDRGWLAYASLGGAAGAGVAAAFIFSNPVGWIVGAVTAIAGGLVTLLSYEIEHLDEVGIIDGPYNI